MAHFVFFDCETTGLPKNYDAPASRTSNWPRIIQLAWMAMEDAQKEMTCASVLIRPEGFKIPRDAVAIHGITTEKAAAEGIALEDALKQFSGALAFPATTLVAHNLRFDLGCVGAEFYRLKQKNPLESLPQACTMQMGTPICRIPGRYGYKWPALEELHRKLFAETLTSVHNALADVRACARCFFAMKGTSP